MRIRCISMLMLGVGISGCGLWGPDYSKPNIDTPSAWNSTDKLLHMNTNANLPDTAWWKSFNDPKLNQLIAAALKYNNNIQQAIGNVIQAQGTLEQVELAWVPSAALKSGYSVSAPFAGSGNGGTANPITTGGGSAGYQVGLVPSYSLNILQQLRQQEAAKAQLIMQQYAKDAMRLTIISQVAGGYFTLSEQNYLLDLQHELVQDTAKLYDLAQGQYAHGYISLLSLQTYLQNYQTAKAQIPIIENNIVASQNSLQILINKNPGPIKMGAKFTQTPMSGIVPANIPSTLLKQRPDVIQAEQNLISANANIGVATSFFFPTLSLTGGAGTASNALNGLFSATNDWWSVQATANMPILNAAQLGVIKGAKGTYYTAYYNYMFTVRQAFQQVDNGLSSHQKISDSYAEQLKVYDSSVLAYQLGWDSFTQGLFSESQALNYKVSMDNAAITLAGLKLQQIQSIITLYQALAGGYKVHDDADSKPIKFGDARDAS